MFHRNFIVSINTILAIVARPMLVAAASGMLLITPVALSDLPPQKLPVYGGSGGNAFTRDCGAGRVMTGVRFRSGLLVDAVGLLCRPVRSDGTLAPETTVGSLAGGSGGTSDTASCPTGSVVVGMGITFGLYVDAIDLYCQHWNATTRTFGGRSTETMISVRKVDFSKHFEVERCESTAQPAHAIRGRSHDFVDAFGLICDEP
jgi:hypothetical protein